MSTLPSMGEKWESSCRATMCLGCLWGLWFKVTLDNHQNMFHLLCIPASSLVVHVIARCLLLLQSIAHFLMKYVFSLCLPTFLSQNGLFKGLPFLFGTIPVLLALAVALFISDKVPQTAKSHGPREAILLQCRANNSRRNGSITSANDLSV